jgi:decaprenyl-phosphate phosphoribosyltransferase
MDAKTPDSEALVSTQTHTSAIGAPNQTTNALVTPDIFRRPLSGQLRGLLSLVRPHQWVKSLLVIPLALATTPRTSPATAVQLMTAVAMFIVAASLTYVGNDLMDRHRDRLHPVKKLRPIASGRVSVPMAVLLALSLLGVLVATARWTSPTPWWPVICYLGLNVAYSLGLKNVPLLDIFIVAAGFVLRAVQGCLAANAPVDVWLIICVFTVCLLLVVGKRRSEFHLAKTAHRPSLVGYSVQYLEYLLVITAGLGLVAGMMFVGEGQGALGSKVSLLVSAPCALFAVARYLQLVVVGHEGEDPSRLLIRDRVLVLTAVIWGLLLATAPLLLRG